MTKTQWTQEEYTRLRDQYLKGVPLKNIALDLSRSLTAVNKQLHRSGIRPNKPRATRDHTQSFSATNKIHRSKTPPLPRSWFYMEEVIRWLTGEGFEIKPSYWNAQESYLLNGERYWKHQVVMITNNLRREKGLDIFYVKGITQE
jgi:hypothetical protein